MNPDFATEKKESSAARNASHRQCYYCFSTDLSTPFLSPVIAMAVDGLISPGHPIESASEVSGCIGEALRLLKKLLAVKMLLWWAQKRNRGRCWYRFW